MKARAPLSFSAALYDAEAFSFTPALVEKLAYIDGWTEHSEQYSFLNRMELLRVNKSIPALLRKNGLERALPMPVFQRMNEWFLDMRKSLIV